MDTSLIESKEIADNEYENGFYTLIKLGMKDGKIISVTGIPPRCVVEIINYHGKNKPCSSVRTDEIPGGE